jgi:Effector Associated Constant Component 1
MRDESVRLRVDVGLGLAADPVELDDETMRLREELLQLDVDAVERPRAGPAPEGTRAGEAAVLGTLVVAVGRELIGSVIRSIEAWFTRSHSHSVKLTLDGDCIELSKVSDADQLQLLEAFLARHAYPVE